MKKNQTTTRQWHYSPRAVLAAIGLKMRAMEILKPIEEQVQIKQKRIKYSPVEKLTDALITILGGAKGLSEVNTRLRSDQALQKAFGRQGCAEQSVVQETLDACTSTNVAQLMQALNPIFTQHSLTSKHDFRAQMLMLDIDLTGLPCGKTYEYATKGYQGEAGIRWGRQMGRVLAAQYEEIVIDRLYPGNLYLTKTLRPLVSDLEQALALTEVQRQRTIIRMDAGGGSLDEINWLLERGYQIHAKDFSALRAAGLAQGVKHWLSDPKQMPRQMGWVESSVDGYVRPVRRLILRWPPMKEEKWKKRPFHYACLLSTLEPEEVIRQLNLPLSTLKNQDAVTLAYSKLYDKRGGTVEVEFKESKQGIGLHQRSKKRFTAQQMIILLTSLAHNILVWSRRWLSADAPRLAKYGALRMVRDLFHINGLLEFSECGTLLCITLNQAAPHVTEIATSLAKLVAMTGVEIKVGVT
ncbi:MAG TPA: transposase [Blastocatellia bacterium]|nr:transposase [Blastocatellia bacterium]